MMKGPTPAQQNRGRPPKDGGPAKGRIVINCSHGYEEWFDRVAEKLRSTRAAAFDRVFAEWAEREGFEPPPPRT
jgi:hypothetical protein